jgi:Protein of unknown function (DUF2934)
MARAKTPRNGDAAKNVTPINKGLAGKGKTKKSSPPADLQEEIRRRAYQLYEERGYTPGDEREDWLVAEREILARQQQMA